MTTTTVPGRYARWARARRLIHDIQAHLAAGGAVQVVTHLRATQYDSRHVAMFKATRSGAYVQHGRSWACIDFTPVRFSRLPVSK